MSQLSLLLGVAALLGLATSLQAQSPHAGSYNGYFYARLSGRVELPESAFGPALLNVDAAGAVRQSGGGLLGHADGTGTITWQVPNAFEFTSGSIRDGVLAATGSRTDAGLTTTFRLEARQKAGAFGAGGGFGQALRLVHPIPHVDELEGAAYGNGTFVAVGRGGMILRSPDAVQWLHVPTGLGTALQDVAFGDGRFVAVGHGGLVLVSTDAGLTWSVRPSGTSFDFLGVSHGNGRFVAVGRAGVHTSTGGDTWAAATIPNSNVDQWDSVDFVNGRFVAAGGRSGTGLHNEITVSTDGITWSPAQSYNANLRTSTFQAAYGNGRYVLTAGSGLGGRTYTFTSPDGSGAAFNVQPVELRGVAFDPARNLFLAAVDRNGGELRSSPDGVTWTLVATNTGTRSDEFLSAGGRLVSAGLTLATSADARTWSILNTNAPTRMNAPVTGAAIDRAFAANGILRGFASPGSITTSPTLVDAAAGPGGSLYGVGPGGTLMQLRTGPNTSEARLASNTTADLHGIASNTPQRGNAIVAVGQAGTILSSTDGFTWTARPSGVTARLHDVAADISLFVAVGEGGTILTAPASNLAQWSPAASGTTHTLRSVANQQFLAGNQLVSGFVAVGDAGTILASVDGFQWSHATSGTTSDLVAVLPAPARTPPAVYALQSDGVLLQSTNNAATWREAGPRLNEPGVALAASATTIYAAGRDSRFLSTSASGNAAWRDGLYPTPPASTGMSGVVHGNGRFVAVGPNATGTSEDGEQWTFHHLPAGLTRVSFAAGRFVAAGEGGVAAVSFDGTTWQTRWLGSANIGDVTHGNGQFVAAGALGKAYTSPDALTWTERTTGISTTIEALAFGNGLFVGVGPASQVISTNGVTWQNTALARNLAIHDIHHANGLWIRVGENSRAGIIQSSTNGTAWTTRLQLSGNSQLYGVTWIQGLWVAVGEPPANDQGAGVYTSTNGLVWSTTSAHRNGPLRAIAGGNGIAVAVGDAQAILKAEYPDAQSPILTRHPSDTEARQGGTLTLSVQASGSAPLAYQWRRDGLPLADGGRIAGSTSSTLTITGITSADAGSYSVLTANESGSRLSQPARVTVTDQGGGEPTPYETWRQRFPLPPGKTEPGDDADGDRLANVVEYAFGSDPTRADSGELPQIAIADDAGTAYPAVSFIRDPRLHGVHIDIEAAANLDFATPIATTEVAPSQPLGNGLERVTIRANLPATALPRIFFRSTVRLAP